MADTPRLRHRVFDLFLSALVGACMTALVIRALYPPTDARLAEILQSIRQSQTEAEAQRDQIIAYQEAARGERAEIRRRLETPCVPGEAP